MSDEEHLSRIYITSASTRRISKREKTCLTLVCTYGCGDFEHITDGFDVAAVMAAANAHIEREKGAA